MIKKSKIKKKKGGEKKRPCKCEETQLKRNPREMAEGSSWLECRIFGRNSKQDDGLPTVEVSLTTSCYQSNVVNQSAKNDQNRGTVRY